MAYEINKQSPLDLDPDIGVGLSFPLNPASQDFQVTLTTIDQAKHNLRNLLLTMKGERPLLPDFGTNLHRLIFEQNFASNQMVNFIENEIKTAVKKWLPYIGISDIGVSPEEDRFRFIISIKYVVAPSAANQTIILAASGESGQLSVSEPGGPAGSGGGSPSGGGGY